MTTAYSPLLKLALPVQGELSGTWGDTVNDSITSMIEEAVAGRATINTWTTNSHVLTTVNGLTSEARAAMLNFADGAGLAAAGTVICPTSTKIYIAKNSTSYVITLKTSAGTGVAIPVGSTMLLYCDGTNVVEGLDRVTGAFTVGGTVTTAGVSVTADSITANAQDGMTLEFTGGDGVISADRTGGNYAGMRLKTTDGVAPRTRINMDYNGDVSFYEPTGTTPKFFWDASAEFLGIGTSSPSAKLDVYDPASGSTQDLLVVRDYLGGGSDKTRLIVKNGGNVGIGTSSPSTKGHFYSATSMDQLTVDGTGAIETGINFASGGTTYGQIYFNNVSPYDMSVLQQYSTGSLIFGTNDTERMRIDATGAATFSGGLTTGTGLAAAISNAANIVLTPNASGESDIYTSSGSIRFLTPGGASLGMVLDASGNLGIGVVPEAWTAGYRALEVGGFSLLNTNGDFSSTFIQSNAYYNGAWKYKTTGLASQFVQTSGFSTWSRAVSGTADAALTWIEDMRLDASGNLSVTGQVKASRFISFEVAYSSGTLTVLTMAAGATYLITARGANYGGTDNRHGSTFLATRANNGDFTHGTLIADSGVLGTFAVSGNDVTYSAGGGIPATTIAVTRIA
jgi:hypothetical protein